MKYIRKVAKAATKKKTTRAGRKTPSKQHPNFSKIKLHKNLLKDAQKPKQEKPHQAAQKDPGLYKKTSPSLLSQPFNFFLGASHPIQSMKTTKVEGLFYIDNSVSDQSRKTKENLTFWIDKTSFLKTISFPVFQTVQNKQEGSACHTFFHFFPTLKLAPAQESLSPTVESTSSREKQSIQYLSLKLLPPWVVINISLSFDLS